MAELEKDGEEGRISLDLTPSSSLGAGAGAGSATAAHAEEDADADDALDLDLGNLDITTVDLDFEAMEEDIEAHLNDDLVKEALEKGVDLRQYARQVEKDLLAAEQESIGDYLDERDDIARLHNQIQACDSILANMERMLGAFQEDLGTISSEIQTLQEQSLVMNVKLTNRRQIHGKLGSFVGEIVVPPELVSEIVESEVTDAYLDALMQLNRKINFMRKHGVKSRAAQELSPEVEKLKLRALGKLRDFLLHHIHSLRREGANYEIVQQNVLLKHKYFNYFLIQHGLSVAAEVRHAYEETVSKCYAATLKHYMGRLMKLLNPEQPERDDLLGTEDSAKRTRNVFTGKVSFKNRSGTFSAGARLDILRGAEAAAIVPAAARQLSQRYAYEEVFRSYHYALLDNCTSEFLFCTDFFNAHGDAAVALFRAIFGKSLTVYVRHAEQFLPTCHDAIGLMLCLRLNETYRQIMLRRKIPCLEQYFAWVAAGLSRRLVVILDANTESVRSMDPKRMAVDIHPHYVTRRYAEFGSALAYMNEELADQGVHAALARMREAVEGMILRMGAEFPQRREQLIYLINNYDVIISVFGERTSQDSEEIASFRRLIAQRTEEFVEEILAPHFGNMIAFVGEWEPRLDAARQSASGGPDALRFDLGKVEAVVRSFASGWRKAIDSINQDVMRSFANFRNGTAILQATLTQLILYYQRFVNVLAQPPFRSLAVRNELINIHHVMVEVRKNRANF